VRAPKVDPEGAIHRLRQSKRALRLFVIPLTLFAVTLITPGTKRTFLLKANVPDESCWLRSGIHSSTTGWSISVVYLQ
jgi:hypothetical protein